MRARSTILATVTTMALFALSAHAEPIAGVKGVFTPYVGEWQSEGDDWGTTGEEPPGGWYLRTPQEYDLQSVEFSVRKDKADGFVWVYLHDWEVLLRKNRIAVKYARNLDTERKNINPAHYFWNCAYRLIDFPEGKWSTFKLTLDGQHLTVHWNGREAAKFNSPEQEWGERIRSSKLGLAKEYRFLDRFPEDALAGENQMVVLHAYQTPVAFKDLRLVGKAKGPATGFHTPYHPTKCNERWLDDEVIQPLLPLEPVDVTWKLESEDAQKASTLAPVTTWEITEDQKSDIGGIHYGFGRNYFTDLKTPEYYVGHKEDPGGFPKRIWGMRGKPRDLMVYFNLDKPGLYTLINDNLRLGSGPIPLEISVDGKPVSRAVYRRCGTAPCQDYVPLRLAEGPHRMSMRFLLDNICKFTHAMKSCYLDLGRVALVPGLVDPVQSFTAAEKSNVTLDTSLPLDGEHAGKALCYEITGLEAGAQYTVKPVFYDVEVRKPGARLMDLHLNGTLVERDLDVIAEAGWRAPLEKAYPVKAEKAGETGRIRVKLVGKTNKAFLNALFVEDAQGRQVFGKAWATTISPQTRRVYFGRGAIDPVDGEPAPWTPEQAFDGHNLILNPHFCLHDKERGRPLGWYSVKELEELTRVPLKIDPDYDMVPEELRKHWDRLEYEPTVLRHYQILPGAGEYTVDEKVGHDQPGSLRVAKAGEDFGLTCNWPNTDFGKLQEFSFWVKTDNADGAVFAEVYWLSYNMFANLKWTVGGPAGEPLPLPNIQLLGKTSSEQSLTGAKDWTRVSVKAKPPLGAVYAMPVVRVKNQTTGLIWIDDAEMNAHGAEPLEISRSLLGYHPKGDKSVVAKSISDAPVKWELVEAKTGKVRQSGQAEHHHYEWYSKRHYFTFDFTGFEEPGEYRIRLIQDGRQTETKPFPIDKGVYHKLCDVALNGIYFSRYNVNIDSFHEPEALEDAQAMLTMPGGLKRYDRFEQPYLPERRNCLYGYYDAGDEYKKPQYWVTAFFAAASMQELVEPVLSRRTTDDALDEVIWAIKSYENFQRDNGAVARAMLPSHVGRNLDNIPRYGLDRALEEYDLEAPQVAGTAALCAYLLKDRYPEWSKRALVIAEKNYAYNFDEWARETRQKGLARLQGKPRLGQRMFQASKGLLAQIYLHAVTGDPKYKEHLDEDAKDLIEAVKNKAWRFKAKRGDEELDRSYFEMSHTYGFGFSQDFIAALCHFVKMHPEHPLAGEGKAALRVFADDVKRVSSYSPWGQAWDLATSEDKTPKRWLRGHGWVLPYWAMLSYNLAHAGILLDDPEVIRLAERQMQWLLGKNVVDASSIHGVGDRMFAGGAQALDRPAFVDAWLESGSDFFTYDGLVSSATFRGPGDGRASGKPAQGDRVPIGGLPKGFLSYWLQGNMPTPPGPAERYLPLQGCFAIGAAGVQAGMQYLEERGK